MWWIRVDAIGESYSIKERRYENAEAGQDESHDPSHIVCADGSLHTISKGGMVRVGIMDTGTRGADEGFYVWG